MGEVGQTTKEISEMTCVVRTPSSDMLVFDDDQAPKKDETTPCLEKANKPAVSQPRGRQAQAYAWLCSTSMCFVVLFLWEVACLVLLWLGVASRESCDKPLASFCLYMAILSSVGLLLAFVTVPGAVRAVLHGDQSSATGLHIYTNVVAPYSPSLMCLSGIVMLARCVLFCIGLVWLLNAANFKLFDDSTSNLTQAGDVSGSNCETAAHTLFTMVHSYYMVSMGVLGALLCLLVCVCIAACLGEHFEERYS